MTKLRWMIAFAVSLITITVLGIAAAAQQEVPSPYAGLKNPFPWNDPAAQQAGKKVYQQSCLGCHGVKGDSLAASNFSTPGYAEGLQNKADLYFWILSEGRLDKGMPPYKSSLSDTQRWQSLTYIWSLGKQAPPPATATPAPKPSAGGVLQVATPKEAQSGRSISLVAYLHDGQGRPVADAEVKFFLKASFFAQGLMEIGDATTDKEGTATLDTVLPEAGDVQIVAQYETLEATTTLGLTPSNKPFYQTTVGIRMPTIGNEVFIGPVVSEGLGEMAQAPSSALRLPGGILSWLLLPVAAVLLIWSTYCYVMYQVLHISPSHGTAGSNTRMVPYVLLVVLALIGISLALKVATGPYSQFHLFP